MWWQQAGRRVGGGEGCSDGCYWSFLSDSDDSSLAPSSSGGVSSYLQEEEEEETNAS